jgi:hypothetical protein
MFQIRASTMLRKKPENKYPYINPHTAQCAGASIGQGGAPDNDEAGGYDPLPLPSTLEELRQRRLQYFSRSDSVAVSVAAQGLPEVVNAVKQVIVVTEPYTTIPHTPPTIHHYTT